MTKFKIKTVTLSSGERVPAFGMGTWHMGEDPANYAEELATLRLGLDVLEIAPRAVGLHVAGQEQLAEPLERCQWRAKLVRDYRKELALGLVDLAQPLRGPRNFVFELLGE